MLSSALKNKSSKRSTTAAGLGATGASSPSFAVLPPTAPRSPVLGQQQLALSLSPSEMARTDEWKNNVNVSFSNIHPSTQLSLAAPSSADTGKKKASDTKHIMSDLDRVVAGFLSVADIQQENESLRRENEAMRLERRETRAVKITGLRGGPVYASAQLDDGEFEPGGFSYKVSFRQQRMFSCYARDLKNLEVHIGPLGRVEIGRITDCYRVVKNDGVCTIQSIGHTAVLWDLVFQFRPCTRYQNAMIPPLHLPHVTNIIDEDPTFSVSFDYINIPVMELENYIDNFHQRLQEAESQPDRGLSPILGRVANNGDNING